MKCEKVQTSLLDANILLKNAPFGTVVKQGTKLLMRLKPVNFLCNSTIINDAISKGNCTVADMQSGTVYITEGDKLCKLLDTKMLWSEK